MFIVAKEVALEIGQLVAAYLRPRRYLRLACGTALLFGAVRVVLALCSLISAVDNQGFDYPRVYGRCLYDDGGRIPIQGLALEFRSENGSESLPSSDRLGVALVDDTTGDFECVLRVLPSQANRSIKIAVLLNSGLPAPSDIIPPQYAAPHTTPLQANPKATRIALRIAKPAS